ncbi:MAG: T9SS type A sorting domain-containing protein [Saprospiraceae bacterium]
MNASVPANTCVREFSPLDFLSSPDLTCNNYSLDLAYPFGTNNLGGKKVDRSHIGYTFIFRVTSGNNSCWGYLTVEDKAPPQPICKSGTISCFQFNKINELTKEVIDNCSQEGSSVIESLVWTDYACTQPAITGEVIRTIRTFDQWGNSASCKDTLRIRKDSFSLLKAPDYISLSCIMLCKKADNTKSAFDKANFDTFTFSSNEKDSNYPSPEKLIQLQKRDTFGSTTRSCIPSNLKVVPFIRDSVFQIVNGQCVRYDSCIAVYPTNGVLCKLIVSYSDLIFPVCGNGFKVRREWRFTNWCTSQDTLIIQYIAIEDKLAPEVASTFTVPFNLGKRHYNIVFPGYRINASTGAHDCVGNFCLDSLTVNDCSKVTQSYSVSYTDPSKEGSILIKNGTPKECFSLPAIPNNYLFLESFLIASQPPNDDVIKDITMPRNCHIVTFEARDECYNITKSPIKIYNAGTGELIREYQTNHAGFALVCITDDTPPTPVCDEFSQTTIDPTTCWSRIYASDLDNGSRDNCCNVLHFAVANMDTIDHYQKAYAKQIEDSCGKAEYWKNKVNYDQIISDWINCYIFKDYVDVTECGQKQLVLRVYEACGVPRYDDHAFKCSAHEWFCYNSYPLFQLWHNYNLDNEKPDYCTKPWPWLCLDNHHKKIAALLEDQKNYWLPRYVGATILFISPRYPIETLYCLPFFYDPRATVLNTTESFAPGNTCSKRLYADCMINILIDDKTPPKAEEPIDKFWYCDNVSSVAGDIYEYAKCNDESWKDDNAKDLRCEDELGKPYYYIESKIENDLDQSDTLDGVGKYFGWYGCNVYGGSHPDEHGIMIPCDNNNGWAPLYCRSWLILDTNDAAGKVNPRERFDSPILRNGAPVEPAAAGKFYIWDNCWIDPSSLDSTDESYFDQCGNGWIKRTWKVKDKCGNAVSVDQKITTKHRSDFEVLFPEDKVSVCGNDEDLSPDAIGRPMIMDDECELIGINYEDQRFDIVPDACYKIIRTWRIVDWCKYDPNQHKIEQDIIVDDRRVADKVKRPCIYRHVKDNGDGYMSYIQIIVIKDTVAPVVTTRDTTICFYDNGCTIQSVNIPFTATDNCTAPDLLSFRYEIDENPSASDLANKTYNKSSIDKLKGNVKSFTSTQKVGTALVHVIAEDNCGNEDTSTFVMIIKDCKKPTPYCYHGIATVIMPTTGSIKIWAKDLNAGSYDNCTLSANLKFTFGPLPKDSCWTYTCKDIDNGVAATKEIDLYVTDEAGNTDFCRTFINLQDGSGNVCEDAKSSSLSVSGSVYTNAAQSVEDVMVEAKTSNYLPSYKTNSSGQYAFINIPFKGPIAITAQRNDAAANGVSTIDLLKIQRHILGIEPITDPYNLIAADINNDKEITTGDLIELRKIILNISAAFANNTSWRFVPKSFQFNSNDPYSFPEKIDIASLEKDELNRDFVGIKVGDVNQTAIAHTLLGAEARSSGKDMILNVNDAVLKSGEVVSIEVKAGVNTNLQSFQFTLSHPYLDVINLQEKQIKFDKKNIGLFHDATTTSWENAFDVLNVSDKVLFTITLKARKDLKLSESISINSRITPAEAFDGKDILGIALIFDHQKAASQESYSLYQNTPNPFNHQTSIGFVLPDDESIDFTITDIMGKTVYQQKLEGKKGYNQVILHENQLQGSGIYYYSLDTKNFKQSKKLVLLK